MPTFIAVSDLKTALRITDASQDTELGQIIDRVEARLQSMTGRPLALASFTESYSGTGRTDLMLDKYPLRDVTSIENTDSSETIDPTDSDVVRFSTGADAPAILLLQTDIWQRGDFNYSIEYDAGYDPAAITTEAPGIWECVLDWSAHLWQDMLNRRRGVAAQSSMDGSITYYDPLLSVSDAFKRLRIDPVVSKFRKVRGVSTRPGYDPLFIRY